MERFELEDIVGQSNSGIVYRAIDNNSKEPVAIHRFFPFDQFNGGLDKDESAGFVQAAKRLAEVRHPGLRRVITGDTDPIDHVPFIVTEWVEGVSLQTLLADETMEPELVMDTLRLALESSISISEALQEEAVWVKTSTDSIVVGTEKSSRGFTFCISPLKWLGAQSEGKNLLSLVKLGESLIGWEGRLVSDRSGHGLGGWFKQIKHHPDTSLRDALDSLNQLSAIAPPDEGNPVIPYDLKPVASPKKGTPKGALAAVALLAVSVPAALLFYLQKTAKNPAVELGYSEQEIKRAITEPDARAEKSSVEGSAIFPDQEQTKIALNSSPAIAGLKSEARESGPQRASAIVHPPAEQVVSSSTGNLAGPPPFLFEAMNAKGAFEPVGEVAVKRLITGLRVRMRGELSEVKTVSSSGSIFLGFSSAEGVEPIRGVIRGKDFDGEFSPEVFEKYRGQVITLHGRIINMGSGEFPLVKIVNLSDLAVEK